MLSMKVYTIKLGEDSTFYLDLPFNLGQDTTKYRATLGHKANHSFRPNCRYGQIRHPRWGLIVAIFSTRKINKGEELLCNYGYNPDKQLVPDWYREAWEENRI